MPFTKHFIELRKRFKYVFFTFVVLLIVFYSEYFFGLIKGVLLYPIQGYLDENVIGGQLMVTGPFEMMTFRFKLAMYAAFVASSPVIFYNIFAFIMPAIKKKERRWLIPTVVAAVLLFLIGVAFAYFVIMGPAFEFLFEQGAGQIGAIASADLYLSGIAMMLIGFGIAFELPLVVFYLIGWGIVPFDAMLKSWRIAVVLIMIVAAIATPDWSPINMGGLSLALIALYFGALALARIVFAAKIKQQRIDKIEYDEMYAEEEVPDEDLDLPDNFDKLSRKEQMIARGQAQTQARKAK